MGEAGGRGWGTTGALERLPGALQPSGVPVPGARKGGPARGDTHKGAYISNVALMVTAARLRKVCC